MSKESEALKLVKVYAGHVIIRNGPEEYNDTAENFEIDAEEAFPALPGGNIGRSYVPGEWHRVTTGRKATSLPMPWAEGDELLGRVAELIAAQTARRQIPGEPPDPGINQFRLDALEAALERLAQDPNASRQEKDYQTKRRTS